MREDRDVLAYFITFTCYGTWLHGDPAGSKVRLSVQDVVELPANEARERYARDRMTYDPLTLGLAQRRVVDAAIREACEFKSWRLSAINVRTNHVHLVVSGDVHPDRIMSTVKARATFRLRERKLVEPGTPLWTEHGSTRWLWTVDDVNACCAYVLDGQGGPISFRAIRGGATVHAR